MFRGGGGGGEEEEGTVKCTESLIKFVYHTLATSSPPGSLTYSSQSPSDLFVPRVKNFLYQGSRLWNSLIDDIKTSSNFSTSKKLLKTWNDPEYNCNYCRFTE